MKKISTGFGIALQLFAASILFTACEKELKLAQVSNSNKIVLLGELTAGDTMLIRAGRSASFSGDTTIFKLIENLKLDIGNGGNVYTMTGMPDWNSEYYKTIPYSLPIAVLPGTSYTIKGAHPELEDIECNVTIPRPFEAAILDTATASHPSLPLGVLRFRIDIQDNPAEDNFYVAEVLMQEMMISGYFIWEGNWYSINGNEKLYDSLSAHGPVETHFDTTAGEQLNRIMLYTNDHETENLKIGNNLSYYRRILLSDRSFSGGNHILTIDADKTNMFPFSGHGRLLVKVKSVAREYFEYLRLYERGGMTDGFYNNSLPLKLEGNVKNGLGVVGGVFLRQFTYTVQGF